MEQNPNSSFSLEEILSFVDLRLVNPEDFIIGDLEGDHAHWDPINEFYNHCHGKGGKFCPTNGGGGGGGEGKGVSGKATIAKTVSKGAKKVGSEITSGPTESKTTNVLVKVL